MRLSTLTSSSETTIQKEGSCELWHHDRSDMTSRGHGWKKRRTFLQRSISLSSRPQISCPTLYSLPYPSSLHSGWAGEVYSSISGIRHPHNGRLFGMPGRREWMELRDHYLPIYFEMMNYRDDIHVGHSATGLRNPSRPGPLNTFLGFERWFFIAVEIETNYVEIHIQYTEKWKGYYFNKWRNRNF